MKKTCILRAVLSAVAAAFVLSSCTKEESFPESIESPESTEKTAAVTIPYTVTVNGEPETRATVDGDWKTLRFAEGDQLYFCGADYISGGVLVKLKGVLDIQTGVGDTSGAVFSGNLTFSGTGTPEALDLFIILTSATLVSAQQTVGKELSVDENGIVSVNYPNNEYCETVEEAVQRYSMLTGASFYPKKSFTLYQSTTFLNFEMTFEDGTAAGTELSATVTTNRDDGPICTANVTTREEGGKVVAKFVLPMASSNTLKYANVKLGEREGISFGSFGQTLSAKVYNVKKTVEFPGSLKEVPLTIQALTAGTVKVSMTLWGAESPLSTGMKYAVNGGEKILINNSTDIPLNAGDKVQFYGNGTNTQYYGSVPEVRIQGAGEGFRCRAYGNIMSLLNENGFAAMTAFPDADEESVFAGLFEGNTALTDASGLQLPATTLAKLCYSNMFKGCTALTKAPELPATTLVPRCYSGMFEGCTALTETPALPATTLAERCYQSMYQDCTALTRAPELPATTLAEWCYYLMFNGCTALTAAPDLPAPNPVANCYGNMFSGCKNLRSVKCLATSGLDGSGDCFLNWLEDVAATGTFYLADRTGLIWPEGDNGIPEGWTGRYPDGKTWNRPYPLSSVKAGDVGKLVGADGMIYHKDVTTKEGITTVAMVAYVGNESDCENGLAIALNDEDGGKTKILNEAKNICSAKTAVSGGTWRLPSVKDWQYMFIGGGSGQSYQNQFDNSFIFKYAPLNEKIVGCSGQELKDDHWTSTTVAGYSNYAYIFRIMGDGTIHSIGEHTGCRVRACLAF